MRLKPIGAVEAAPKKTGRGGARAGAGRVRGSKNKLTVEKEEAAKLVAQKMMTGQDGDLGKTVLEKLMAEAMKMAEKFKPTKNSSKAAQRKWKEWSKLAGHWARHVAPFQSPTFKAVAIQPMMPVQPGQIINDLLDAIDVDSRDQPIQIGTPMPARIG